MEKEKLVNIKYHVYSTDKNQSKILELYYYDNKEGAEDMAYRLKKYSPKVFICQEVTYEYDEE